MGNAVFNKVGLHSPKTKRKEEKRGEERKREEGRGGEGRKEALNHKGKWILDKNQQFWPHSAEVISIIEALVQYSVKE